jgi:hypothetical protein
MFGRCLKTSVAALALVASFAATGLSQGPGEPAARRAADPALQRLSLLKAMSEDIVVDVPVAVTLPADYRPLFDPEHSTNGTFWATAADLRAAVHEGEVDTTKLKRGLFWFRHSLNVGYDAQTDKFIPEMSTEDLARQTGATNLKVTQKTVNGRATLTITGNKGNRSLYLLYVWTGIDTNCVLVSYHHPAGAHSPQDDQAWTQLVAGLGQ